MSSHLTGLSQWNEEVSTHLPHLSKAQAGVLAMYSYGMVLLGHCGMSRIAYFLSKLLDKKENTMRQRLREVLYDGEDKRGKQRQELRVEGCFAGILKWVVSWWTPTEKRLALAMDASTLGQRFTILSISVLYRGCAIPVAWVVLPATQKGKWMPHWKRLLRGLRHAIPGDWMVIVLTDRGLYSKDLYHAIRRNSWHPMMRINATGKFRPQGESRFRPLQSLVPKPRTVWCGAVDCFATPKARLSCTLLTWWDADAAEAWLLLTDLPPQALDGAWYAMRMWIEHGFKDAKRGGFHWEHTKMTDPRRATRLWLVIALATLCSLSVADTADGLPTSSDLPHLNAHSTPQRLSSFTRGLINLLVAALRHLALPPTTFVPQAWPASNLNLATVLVLSEGGYCVHY